MEKASEWIDPDALSSAGERPRRDVRAPLWRGFRHARCSVPHQLRSKRSRSRAGRDVGAAAIFRVPMGPSPGEFEVRGAADLSSDRTTKAGHMTATDQTHRSCRALASRGPSTYDPRNRHRHHLSATLLDGRAGNGWARWLRCGRDRSELRCGRDHSAGRFPNAGYEPHPSSPTIPIQNMVLSPTSMSYLRTNVSLPSSPMRNPVVFGVLDFLPLATRI